MEEGARAIVRLQRLIVTMAKPVVVEVGGPVRAGGIGIVAAADVAVAAEDATFALTEVKLGLAAAIISLTVHHRMNPRAAALDHARRRGVQRHRRGGVRAGHEGGPGRPTSTRRSRTVCASLATGAAQGLRESKRILNRDLVERIDARGDEMAALSATLRLRRGARGDDGLPLPEVARTAVRGVGLGLADPCIVPIRRGAARGRGRR